MNFVDLLDFYGKQVARMPSRKRTESQFVKNSVLYKEFLAEREEILKHKWIESEKAGTDIGFEKALARLDRETSLQLARRTNEGGAHRKGRLLIFLFL